MHLDALIKFELSSICELLNTSKTFGNYFLITYLSGTRHSNFSLAKHTLKRNDQSKPIKCHLFRETFLYEVMLYLHTNVEGKSFRSL